jgi:hypothetical protein
MRAKEDSTSLKASVETEGSSPYSLSPVPGLTKAYTYSQR